MRARHTFTSVSTSQCCTGREQMASDRLSHDRVSTWEQVCVNADFDKSGLTNIHDVPQREHCVNSVLASLLVAAAHTCLVSLVSLVRC